MSSTADAVEQRALELWARRHNLSAAEYAEVDQLPEPARTAFRCTDARRAGRRDEALALATRAIPQTRDPSVWRGHLLRLQGAILADLRLSEQAVAANTQAQSNARAVGDDLGLACCLQDLATYPHQPIERVLELLAEAREIAVGARIHDLVILIDFNLAWYASEMGRPEPEVIAAYAAVEAAAGDVWPDLAAEARACQVRLAAQSGDLRRARELAAALPDESQISDEDTRTAVACARAWVLADEGRVDDADEMLRRWLPTVTEDRRIDLLTTRSAVLAHAGRYAEAWRASQYLVQVTKENADSLGSAQARALEVWYRTRIAEDATRREQARADELEQALAELREAHERIRELSTRDILTGLHNRAHLMTAGEEALAEASPGRPVAVSLADIDSFKTINDSFGHRTGDDVLVALADVARELLDPRDICARHGGEEFVVIRPAGVRPEVDLGADLRAVGRSFGRRDFGAEHGTGPHRVTLSGGLVHVTGGSLEEALHAADQLMYVAKRAGGNRLVSDIEG